jgi:hypothetical protein
MLRFRGAWKGPAAPTRSRGLPLQNDRLCAAADSPRLLKREARLE